MTSLWMPDIIGFLWHFVCVGLLHLRSMLFRCCKFSLSNPDNKCSLIFHLHTRILLMTPASAERPCFLCVCQAVRACVFNLEQFTGPESPCLPEAWHRTDVVTRCYACVLAADRCYPLPYVVNATATTSDATCSYGVSILFILGVNSLQFAHYP